MLEGKSETMEMTPSDKTVETILKHISNIPVELPLKSEDDLSKILAYFTEIEDDLSNGLGSGMEIDATLLQEAALVNTELNPFNEGDFIDLEKLNKRLMKF